MSDAVINQLHAEIQRLHSDLNAAQQMIEILEAGNARWERLMEATLAQLKELTEGKQWSS